MKRNRWILEWSQLLSLNDHNHTKSCTACEDNKSLFKNMLLHRSLAQRIPAQKDPILWIQFYRVAYLFSKEHQGDRFMLRFMLLCSWMEMIKKFWNINNEASQLLVYSSYVHVRAQVERLFLAAMKAIRLTPLTIVYFYRTAVWKCFSPSSCHCA